MRKYSQVWTTLKTKGTAELTVTKAGARRILNGLKLEKTIENTARRDAGLIGWSKLVIRKHELSATHLKIVVSFDFSTRL